MPPFGGGAAPQELGVQGLAPCQVRFSRSESLTCYTFTFVERFDIIPTERKNTFAGVMTTVVKVKVCKGVCNEYGTFSEFQGRGSSWGIKAR